MRDRMRRRKKPADSGKTGPAPLPPLQPSFADALDAAAAAPPSGETDEPEPPAAGDSPQPTPRSTADSSAVPADSSGAVPADSGQPRRRRRRGRGGRGRAKSSATPLQPAYPEVAAAPGRQQPQPATSAAPPQPAPAAETPAPTTGTQPAAQPSKGTVVLAIGLPGSGKSTWFKRREVTPLSSDLVRTLLFDNVSEQRYQDLVFSTLRALLRARLVARMPVSYVDATNLSAHDRRGWIKMARDFGYDVQAVFFDVPLEVCMDRNRRRDRVVADDVMQRMSSKLRPPTFDEGFSKITVVRVKRDGPQEPNE